MGALAAKNAVDTGREDADDTSTDDEADADFENADDNTGFDDFDDTEEEDESDDSAATDEDADSDDSEDDADESDESQDSDEDDTSDDEEDADSDKATSKDTDAEAERKRLNDEAAQARIAEKKARAEADALRKQQQEATIQKYLDEAGDDEDERARRELDVEKYRLQEERTTVNEERLAAGLDKAIAAIPLFRSKDKVVKEELASSLDDFEASWVIKDRYGRPTEIKIDPKTGKPADVFEYLQRKAASIEKLRGSGAKDQTRKKSNQKARTMTPPSKAPKKAKQDDDLDAFDEEADRW